MWTLIFLFVVLVHSIFESSIVSPYFPLLGGRYVNLMTLAKCVWSGYCIDYTVTPPNTQAQRPRDLERTAIHLHAGYGSTPLQLGSRENHAREKLLCLPQGSTPEVCVCACVFLQAIAKKYLCEWLLGCGGSGSCAVSSLRITAEGVGNCSAALCSCVPA